MGSCGISEPLGEISQDSHIYETFQIWYQVRVDITLKDHEYAITLVLFFFKIKSNKLVKIGFYSQNIPFVLCYLYFEFLNERILECKLWNKTSTQVLTSVWRASCSRDPPSIQAFIRFLLLIIANRKNYFLAMLSWIQRKYRVPKLTQFVSGGDFPGNESSVSSKPKYRVWEHIKITNPLAANSTWLKN